MASYLLAGMAQARQEAVAERERAALSVAAAPQQMQQQQEASAVSHLEAMLQGVLQRLGVDWQDREGLALASVASSASVASQQLFAAPTAGPRFGGGGSVSGSGGSVTAALMQTVLVDPTPD